MNFTMACSHNREDRCAGDLGLTTMILLSIEIAVISCVRSTRNLVNITNGTCQSVEWLLGIQDSIAPCS